MKLPDDWRMGIYADGSNILTVDVYLSKDEILMHDETLDQPYVVTPSDLKCMTRVATKKGDGLDAERLKGKTIDDLGGLGYEV